MPAQNDAEKVGIEFFTHLGTNMVGAVGAWAFAVLDILSGLRPQMTERQFELALAVFERWGMAVPDSLHGDPPKIWWNDEGIGKLRAYFADTLRTIDDVRGAYDMFPHADLEGNEHVHLLSEAASFCGKTITEIDRLSGLDDAIYCEAFVFGNLIYHCKDVLRAVLGNELTAQFSTEYDIAMKSLKSAHGLVSAPEV